MIEEIKIPEISENVTSGKVVKVLVKKGDTVAVDDILIEFETEKALVEIPSTVAGVIVSLLAEEGQEMQVGDVIAKVETEKEAQAEEGAEAPSSERDATDKEEGATEEEESAPEQEENGANQEESAPDREESAPAPDTKETPSDRPAKEAKAPAPKEKAPKKSSAEPKRAAAQGDGDDDPKKAEAPDDSDDDPGPPVAAAPSVRRLARELGVNVRRVKGTGPGDRITADDVKTAAREAMQAREPAGSDTAAAMHDLPAMPDFSRWGEVVTEELSGVRRLTARSTAISWRTVPHVTQFDQADISDLETFIQKEAPRLQKQEVKLTITAIVVKVVALALQRFPRFNASIDPEQGRIIYKQYVHIGLAVATERGLLVPVVRDADQQTIDQLAAAVVDLAERARNKKIKPDEMEGGTFTISNQGGIGGTQFTPIVMWPQSAILGMSRAAVAPVYRDGAFVPRTLLPLSLSYDHRLNDGADAARFLRFICESLAQPMHLFMGR